MDWLGSNRLKFDKDNIDKVNKDKRCKPFFIEIFFKDVESKDKKISNNTNNSKVDEKFKKTINTMSNENIVNILTKCKKQIKIKNRSWVSLIFILKFFGEVITYCELNYIGSKNI